MSDLNDIVHDTHPVIFATTIYEVLNSTSISNHIKNVIEKIAIMKSFHIVIFTILYGL